MPDTRRTSRRWLRPLLVLLVVGAAAWLVIDHVRGPAVEVVRPFRGPVVQSIVTSGRVRPPGRVTIAPLVPGRVASLAVDEGTRVSAGMVLLELDDSEARTAVDQARAQLEEIDAQGQGVRTIDARSAAEAVSRARTRLHETRRTQVRIRDLFEQGVTSEETLDQANTSLALAESELRAAELTQRDIRGTKTARAEAARRQAEAALATAELRLEHHRLTAPFDGVVIQRGVEIGDIVQPGTLVFVVVRDGDTELVVEPDERNLALLQLGQRAHASAEAFPERTFDARVDFIAPAVDPRRGTVEVRLDVADPPDYLRPDMTVSVEILVGSRDDTLVVPPNAIRELAGPEPWVLVVEGGLTARRALELGIHGDQGIEVLAGIADDDLLLDASVDLEPGTRVHAKESGS